MAGFTASWAHGHAVVMEPAVDDGVSRFSHFGWGAQIVMRPGFSRWFHIAIPTPVFLDGKRMKLIRVFLQWQQIGGHPRSGRIEDAHLWDGKNRIAKKSNNDFKQSGFATLPDHQTYELPRPREWLFGVGLSFKLKGGENVGGHFVDDNEAPIMVIGSAGADFEV